ncbi:MAG: LysM peptidoglycan-binding domain-containing protein [Kiritimatiellaeota bacterium]|nr:LysM peptidoglycan-binding domain-containing protein [Kiritimatiellota bacterium]
MVLKVNAWVMAAALAMSLLAGCTSQVQEQDALEFNYPAIRKARAKLREGDKQSALALLNRAIDEKPRLAQAHLEVAQLYDDYDHNYVRAIYHYERYLELRPQTEKREMIEGFIRKAKLAYAASVAEQVPGLDKKVQALQDDNERLKRDLRQVRENLARRIAAPASRSAVPITPLGRVSGRSGEPASQALRADGQPVSESAIAEPAIAGPATGSVVADSAVAPAVAADAQPTSASASKPAGTHYLVQRGDTLSVVAARVYHNPRKWKLIYNANRDTLGGSQKLKTGQVLIIPK